MEGRASGRSVALVGVAAIALLGVAAWVATRSGEDDASSSRSNGSRDSNARSGDGSNGADPTLPAPATIDAARESSGSRAPKVEPRRVDVKPVEWPVFAFALRGRLVGLDGHVPFTSPILVTPVYAARRDALFTTHRRPPNANGRGLQNLFDRDGKESRDAGDNRDVEPVTAPLFHGDCFALDFQKLAEPRPERELVALEVLADDPHYTPCRRRVALPPHVETTGATVEVDLPVATCAAVTGTVEAPADRPRPDGVVEVALFADVAGSPAGDPLDVATAQPRYRLRAPKDGDYFVVAACGGAEPSFERVALTVGVERDAHAITLARGASITGVVALPGREFRFDRQARDGLVVVATLVESDGPRLELPGHSLQFCNGKVLERAPSASIVFDRKPTFEVGGLHDHTRYRVGLAPLPGITALDETLQSVTVSAPCSDVELAFGGAGLDVDVVSPRGQVYGADVSIGAAHATTSEQDALASFLVAPHQTFELLVTAKGFEPARASAESGDSGRFSRATVPLTPVEPDATLELVVDAADLGALRSAAISFEPRDRARAKTSNAAAFDEGRFKFERLPSGRSLVTLEYVELENPIEGAGSGATPIVEGTWLVGGSFELDVADHDQLQRRVAIARGGKLRVSVSDGEGKSIAANVALHDASGATIDVCLVRRVETPGPELDAAARRPPNRPPLRFAQAAAELWSGHVVPAGAPSETDHALRAGRYSATFDAPGFETKRVDFELRAGEVTPIDVTLRRRT
jgi:hypothetical protein